MRPYARHNEAPCARRMRRRERPRKLKPVKTVEGRRRRQARLVAEAYAAAAPPTVSAGWRPRLAGGGW
jgi:hypothetical protein